LEGAGTTGSVSSARRRRGHGKPRARYGGGPRGLFPARFANFLGGIEEATARDSVSRSVAARRNPEEARQSAARFWKPGWAAPKEALRFPQTRAATGSRQIQRARARPVARAAGFRRTLIWGTRGRAGRPRPAPGVGGTFPGRVSPPGIWRAPGERPARSPGPGAPRGASASSGGF
jgi:hypothetical protein